MFIVNTWTHWTVSRSYCPMSTLMLDKVTKCHFSRSSKEQKNSQVKLKTLPDQETQELSKTSFVNYENKQIRLGYK